MEPPAFDRNDDELSDARWFHRDWLRNAHIQGNAKAVIDVTDRRSDAYLLKMV